MKKISLLLLSLTLLPIAPVAPTQARTVPPRPPQDSVCAGIVELATDHADVQMLVKLIEKYKIELPLGISLSGKTVTHYELAMVLQAIAGQVGEIQPSEQRALVTLQNKYGQVLESSSDWRANQGMASGRVRMQGGASGGIFSGYDRLHTRLPGKAVPPAASVAPAAASVAPAVSPSPITPPPQPSLQAAPAPAEFKTNGKLKGEAIFTEPAKRPNGILSDNPIREQKQPGNTEGYSPIEENPFLRPSSNPLSTFSIDVDTASYSNIRRFISQKQVPPKDAVRVEELINYFPYSYATPKDDKPFSVNTAVSNTPWNPKHKLVQIGLKGKQLETPPPSNLVFLIDVSGSMGQPNKLPLVKQSMCLLAQQLAPQDKVSMVVYAGNAGLVLPPTSGADKTKIMQAIDKLEAGGSTAGGAGIELAYKKAQESFIKGGNNRVILATDGDFNVGASSDAEMVRLIEQKRDKGIFLTVLGFGTGNYKDSKMEALADKGNGNYAYIDTLLESRKVLVNDIRGTLFTIAKDVKIQVEFNPNKVQAYRLIGYENRALRDQDFNDDTKDAGEIGSGHSVTALYEVVPAGIPLDVKIPAIDDLKYQKVDPSKGGSQSDELMQVKLRYKAPQDSSSQLITQVIKDELTPSSADANFSAAIALFGMVLRDSQHKGQGQISDVLKLAEQGKGEDMAGYRSEFIRLVERYATIAPKQTAQDPKQ
jgi:Ca-activated chloride channel homolog